MSTDRKAPEKVEKVENLSEKEATTPDAKDVKGGRAPLNPQPLPPRY